MQYTAVAAKVLSRQTKSDLGAPGWPAGDFGWVDRILGREGCVATDAQTGRRVVSECRTAGRETALKGSGDTSTHIALSWANVYTPVCYSIYGKSTWPTYLFARKPRLVLGVY
jgi:hypothetical protein